MYFVLWKSLRPLFGFGLCQVEELRAMLRRREWEASAKRAKNNRLTLAALQDTLAEAVAFGAESSALYKVLCDRLERGMNWNVRALALLKDLDERSAGEVWFTGSPHYSKTI